MYLTFLLWIESCTDTVVRKTFLDFLHTLHLLCSQHGRDQLLQLSCSVVESMTCVIWRDTTYDSIHEVLPWLSNLPVLSLKQISCSSYFRKYKRKKTQTKRKLRVCTLWFLQEVEWNSILTNLQINFSHFLDCSLNYNFGC